MSDLTKSIATCSSKDGPSTSEPKPKTMSPAQIAANRRNAQKSTGPKTARGRAISKMNAFKHGLLGKEVLVRGRHASESQREFRSLLAQFREHLAPVGPLEEMLVDLIVTTHWRLRRVVKAEAGEIALNVDAGHWQRTRQDPWFETIKWDALGDPVSAMRNSALGNSLMENELKAVHASVEQIGELTEAAIQTVIFHGKPYGLTRDLEELRLSLQQNPEGLEPGALRARQKEQALAYINKQLRLIAWDKAACEEHERNEESARQAAAVLPSSEVLDKIMRYETKLERQLYRAMNQLERLQRQRLGESIPPPVSLEVTENT